MNSMVKDYQDKRTKKQNISTYQPVRTPFLLNIRWKLIVHKTFWMSCERLLKVTPRVTHDGLTGGYVRLINKPTHLQSMDQ